MKEQYFKLYDELPPPIAERAKANFNPNYSHTRSSISSLRDAIHYGFSWFVSREGFSFWHAVEDAAACGYDYPKI